MVDYFMLLGTTMWTAIKVTLIIWGVIMIISALVATVLNGYRVYKARKEARVGKEFLGYSKASYRVLCPTCNQESRPFINLRDGKPVGSFKCSACWAPIDPAVIAEKDADQYNASLNHA